MKNTKKYGEKENDIIAQMFAISYEQGVGFAKGNILKYLERYKRVKKMPFFMRVYYLMLGKGGKSDLRKVEDYCNRWFTIARLATEFRNDTALTEYNKFMKNNDLWTI